MEIEELEKKVLELELDNFQLKQAVTLILNVQASTLKSLENYDKGFKALCEAVALLAQEMKDIVTVIKTQNKILEPKKILS